MALAAAGSAVADRGIDVPVLTVANAGLREGNSGLTELKFHVRLAYARPPWS